MQPRASRIAPVASSSECFRGSRDTFTFEGHKECISERRGHNSRSGLFPIPLSNIPLPHSGRSRKQDGSQKNGGKKSPVLYFCPHLSAFLFSFGQPLLFKC